MEVSYPDIRANIAICLLIIFDFIWFFFSSTRVYPSFTDTNLKFALIAWILTGIGISMGRPKSIIEALVYGASFGAIVYGIFNGTEAAIRPDWRKPTIILADTLWGTILCLTVSCICFSVMTLASESKYTIVGISIFIYVVCMVYIILSKNQKKKPKR